MVRGLGGCGIPLEENYEQMSMRQLKKIYLRKGEQFDAYVDEFIVNNGEWKGGNGEIYEPIRFNRTNMPSDRRGLIGELEDLDDRLEKVSHRKKIKEDVE